MGRTRNRGGSREIDREGETVASDEASARRRVNWLSRAHRRCSLCSLPKCRKSRVGRSAFAVGRRLSMLPIGMAGEARGCFEANPRSLPFLLLVPCAGTLNGEDDAKQSVQCGSASLDVEIQLERNFSAQWCRNDNPLFASVPAAIYSAPGHAAVITWPSLAFAGETGRSSTSSPP